MRFTRVRDLLGAAVVTGLLVHLVVRLAYGTLPPFPPLAGTTLLAVAVVEVVLAFTLRARIHRRPGTRPVQPLTAARSVALAKASSLAGAIMGGAWSGMLVYVLPQHTELAAASGDALSGFVGLGGSLALVGAALWLEYCLKTPPGPDEGRENHRLR